MWTFYGGQRWVQGWSRGWPGVPGVDPGVVHGRVARVGSRGGCPYACPGYPGTCALLADRYYPWVHHARCRTQHAAPSMPHGPYHAQPTLRLIGGSDIPSLRTLRAMFDAKMRRCEHGTMNNDVYLRPGTVGTVMFITVVHCTQRVTTATYRQHTLCNTVPTGLNMPYSTEQSD